MSRKSKGLDFRKHHALRKRKARPDGLEEPLSRFGAKMTRSGLRAPNQANDEQQDHGADEGVDDGSDEATADKDAEPRQ